MSTLHPDAIQLLNLAQALICMGIAANCFERTTRTCKRTLSSIRLAFVWLGLASVVTALWPWWDRLHVCLGIGAASIDAHPIGVLFEAAVLAVQTLTRVHWAKGVPEQYQQSGGADQLGASSRYSHD